MPRKVDRRKPEHRGFRQGERKRDRWGPCSACEMPAAYRCDRCGRWRCNGDRWWARAALSGSEPLPPKAGVHGKLRRLPGQRGRFQWVCVPKCGARAPKADTFTRPAEAPDDWDLSRFTEEEASE